MGRGDRAVKRWKNDRIRAKKARDKKATVRTPAAEQTTTTPA